MDRIATVRVSEAAKVEKIVDYSFEKSEKSNVLAIHPTRPLIAYLININIQNRSQKISKAWSSGNDSMQSPSASIINGQINENNKTVSIRIIDYVTRQRCLAKGIYHARPADCVFTINSLICSQSNIIKLAVVDRLANVYLYDLSYFINDLTATRIAVIRGLTHEISPYESISLVWCPFVPCEDFDDGDGGLRLALATNSKIEIFAVDRLQGRTGELQRSELKGAYKCIQDAHQTDIVTLSISPDCSTISAAALDNYVTFFSSDIDDGAQRCLHNWEASITDKSSISRLFFLDDYPNLLEDSAMKFWGAAFIGTRGGQMLLVDLRTWSVYQKMSVPIDSSGPKNFDYRVDSTSRNIIAMTVNQCYVVQIEHANTKLSTTSASKIADNPARTNNDVNLMDTSNSDLMNGNIFEYLSKATQTLRNNTNSSSNQRSATKTKQQSSSSNNGFNLNDTSGLPRIVRIVRLALHNPIYSFVIKHKSNDELELFTISAYSLERYIINLNVIKNEAIVAEESKPSVSKPVPIVHEQTAIVNSSINVLAPTRVSPTTTIANNNNLDVAQMDRMVEALFGKLNIAFSQGLNEFLSEVKCEVNDLKLKINGLGRDVRKLQQQLQGIPTD